jgi:hypothetical protein
MTAVAIISVRIEKRFINEKDIDEQSASVFEHPAAGVIFLLSKRLIEVLVAFLWYARHGH